MHKPKWFKDDAVVISNALTCGINKDGDNQYIVLPDGTRTTEIDDKLNDDVEKIIANKVGEGSTEYINLKTIKDSKVLVPNYHSKYWNRNINEMIENHSRDFQFKTLGELIGSKQILFKHGHGSPSSDQRIGNIPYIKVSDLRSGRININPTNLIPEELAEKYWGGKDTGLLPYDLISPERAFKNIGEFCVLMPGQEKIVLTREVMVLRSQTETFDQFYLMWAMNLVAVHDQWNRVVLMQTNREDVGQRAFEIVVPIPKSKELATELSSPFRNYYQSLETARGILKSEIKKSNFKFFLHL